MVGNAIDLKNQLRSNNGYKKYNNTKTTKTNNNPPLQDQI
jgi:hypothetical protein